MANSNATVPNKLYILGTTLNRKGETAYVAGGSSLDNISETLKQDGMLAYVSNEKCFYQYDKATDTWHKFIIQQQPLLYSDCTKLPLAGEKFSDGNEPYNGQIVQLSNGQWWQYSALDDKWSRDIPDISSDNYDSLEDFKPEVGAIAYVKEEDSYYQYTKGGWTLYTAHGIASAAKDLDNFTAYEGQITYVKDQECYYQYTNNEWHRYYAGRYVDTIDQLSAIKTPYKGQLVYVESEDEFYIWKSSSTGWQQYVPGNAVSTISELKNITTAQKGSLAYVEEDGYYYSFDGSEWQKYNVTSVSNTGDLVTLKGTEGQRVYVSSEKAYYFYENGEWTKQIEGTVESIKDLDNVAMYEGRIMYVSSERQYYQAEKTGDNWQWVPHTVKYSCTVDTVPENETNSGPGNLPKSLTRKDLEGMTYNEILTKILFKDNMPYLPASYGTPSYNTVSMHVGSDVDDSKFTASLPSVTYGFVKSGASTKSETRSWVLENSSITTSSTVTFGTKSYGSGKVKLTFSPEEIDSADVHYLHSSWGINQTELIGAGSISSYMSLAGQEKTIEKYITGFYYGWSFGGDLNATEMEAAMKKTKFDIQSTIETLTAGNTTTIIINKASISNQMLSSTMKNQQYIYLVIPTDWSLTYTGVQSELNPNAYKQIGGSIPSIDLTGTGSNNTVFASLYTNNAGTVSNIPAYKMYVIPKADFNADGTVSPNAQVMKVSLAK